MKKRFLLLFILISIILFFISIFNYRKLYQANDVNQILKDSLICLNKKIILTKNLNDSLNQLNISNNKYIKEKGHIKNYESANEFELFIDSLYTQKLLEVIQPTELTAWGGLTEFYYKNNLIKLIATTCSEFGNFSTTYYINHDSILKIQPEYGSSFDYTINHNTDTTTLRKKKLFGNEIIKYLKNR